jgi:ParB-like chromosome segregation protein Spo0J
MKTELIDISKIRHNTGQIDGLPSNPRTIKDESYEALLISITNDPEMLELRPPIVIPHKDKTFVTIGGNKRFSAAKDLKYKKLLCIVLPANTSIEKLQAITIKDNVSAGEWDYDALRLDWDEEQLKSWGLDMPELIDEDIDDDILSDEIKEEYKIELSFKSEELRQKSYNKLLPQNYDCRLIK